MIQASEAYKKSVEVQEKHGKLSELRLNKLNEFLINADKQIKTSSDLGFTKTVIPLGNYVSIGEATEAMMKQGYSVSYTGYGLKISWKPIFKTA